MVASDPGPDRLRFFGNVVIGHPPSPSPSPETRNATSVGLSLQELRAHYDTVILAYGASQDRTLGVPGESLAGVLSARAFVGWYNGLPQYRDLFDKTIASVRPPPRLQDVEDVVVIGQGNVAIDVARMLLMSPDVLAKTDMTCYALEALRKSRVKTVRVIGRRGPLQSAFTVKELREILSIQDVRFEYDFALLASQVEAAQRTGGKALDRFQRRMAQVLEKDGRRQAANAGARQTWSLDYLLSPVRFLEDQGRLSGVECEVNELTEAGLARGTGQIRSLPAQLVLRSVGYQSVPIEGVPFDHVRGLVPNSAGRVVRDGQSIDGQLYVTGWLKRGPSGVIATTMQDAYDVADTVILDWQTRASTSGEDRTRVERTDMVELLRSKPGRFVTYDDWKRIEKYEESRPQKRQDAPREKFASVEEMLACLEPGH